MANEPVKPTTGARIPVKLHRRVCLVVTEDAVLAEELLARKKLAQDLVGRLTDRVRAQALQLESTAIGYQPDLVLLTFASNDLRNNSARLEPEKDRPFFVAEGAGLRLDSSFTGRPEFLKRASAFYDAYRSASDRLRLVQLAQATRHSLEGWRGGAAAGILMASEKHSFSANRAAQPHQETVGIQCNPALANIARNWP